MNKVLNLLFTMKFFGNKEKDEDFLDLTTEPLPPSPLDSTSTLHPDNTAAKLDLINTRLQNIEAKLDRIESLLNRQPSPEPTKPSNSDSLVKW